MRGYSKILVNMRRTLVVGNWKMNGSLAGNAVLLADISASLNHNTAAACDVAVCVPAPYLAQVQSALSGTAVAWGAQDMSLHASGAYTGEVSAAMLLEFGVGYVIVGHSERRAYHAESDDIVARKALAALQAGLIPLVCIGETLQEREAGETEAVVGRQLDAVLALLTEVQILRMVVAYEPVWAIGTGKTATPQMAQDVHAFLRNKLAEANADAAEKVQIIYGGSMKPDNARELLAMVDIDGGLIGGAALNAVDFLAIVHAA
jgi:triosephosphate isomerase